MPIHDQGYRRYTGRRIVGGRSWWVIARAGILERVRERRFLALLLFAWSPFVVRAVQIYVASNFSQASFLAPSAETFREFLDQQGIFVFFVTIFVGAGLIAGGQHPDPVQLADVVTFTTHKTLRGPRGGCVLTKAAHAAAIDKAMFPGLQGGPLEHVIAGKAVAFREAMHPSFGAYAAQIVKNASVLAEALAHQGFRLVSGGTDIHLMVVDLRPFDADLTGKEAQAVLDLAGITLNKNAIPNDPRSPFVTSGVRIGTPSVTTQGMTEPEMPRIAEFIARALRQRNDESALARIKGEVAEMCAAFPAYPNGV